MDGSVGFGAKLVFDQFQEKNPFHNLANRRFAWVTYEPTSQRQKAHLKKGVHKHIMKGLLLVKRWVTALLTFHAIHFVFPRVEHADEGLRGDGALRTLRH